MPSKPASFADRLPSFSPAAIAASIVMPFETLRSLSSVCSSCAILSAAVSSSGYRLLGVTTEATLQLPSVISPSANVTMSPSLQTNLPCTSVTPDPPEEQ